MGRPTASHVTDARGMKFDKFIEAHRDTREQIEGDCEADMPDEPALLEDLGRAWVSHLGYVNNRIVQSRSYEKRAKHLLRSYLRENAQALKAYDFNALLADEMIPYSEELEAWEKLSDSLIERINWAKKMLGRWTVEHGAQGT